MPDRLHFILLHISLEDEIKDVEALMRKLKGRQVK